MRYGLENKWLSWLLFLALKMLVFAGRRRTAKVMRVATLITLFVLALSVSAFGQTLDPIGFCPPPGSVANCTTANGLGGESIGIAGDTFAMASNGSSGSSNPWYLLIAIPDYSGPAPTFTSTDIFSQTGSTVNAGDYSASSTCGVDKHGNPVTCSNIYDFASQTVAGLNNGISQNSTSFGNLDGANEQAASGSTPNFFDVFVYTFHPEITSMVVYKFDVAGTGLPAGTFLFGAGGSNNQSTPYTTAGLVNGPGCTGTNGCTAGPGGGTVPEPTSIILLGTIGLLVTTGIRKRSKRA